ncbi:MAG: phosphotransferase [Pseudomonadota bacterium]
MQTDSRLQLIRDWLAADLNLGGLRLEPASADASFRRYFRVFQGDRSLIVMDAPPDKEDLAAYLRVSQLLAGCEVHVPEIEAVDLPRGLALLEDLGSTHYLTRLQAGAAPGPLYSAALAALASIQLRGMEAAATLLPYDRTALAREMELLPEWFCMRHLQFTPDSGERQMLTETFDWLIREALAQPQVFVHRDYHSRNLMVLAKDGPGVIDFQDALRGPVGYDLVSLLKDCYVAWPRERVEEWVGEYRSLLRKPSGSGAGALAGSSAAEFLRWFDLIGLQRHIKVLGIFARLFWRDGKSGYLEDLPRTLEYVRDTARRFPELAAFSGFVEQRLHPQLAAATLRACSGASA